MMARIYRAMCLVGDEVAIDLMFGYHSQGTDINESQASPEKAYKHTWGTAVSSQKSV